MKLNGYNRPTRRNLGPVNMMCWRCPKTETVPYVHNHCMVLSTLYKKRHNVIVSRVKKAASERWTVLEEDQVLGIQNLRPDLVVQKGNDIIIFDATVPFENGLEAFSSARNSKLEKYTQLADELAANECGCRWKECGCSRGPWILRSC